jgi:hypothetical protein
VYLAVLALQIARPAVLTDVLMDVPLDALVDLVIQAINKLDV